MTRYFFLILAIALMCPEILWSQDIILQTDETIIRAKIVSFDENDVLYKVAQNLSGPNYRLPLDYVGEIVFGDGRVWKNGVIIKKRPLPQDIHEILELDDKYDVKKFTSESNILSELYSLYDAYQDALLISEQEKMDLFYQRIHRLYDSQTRKLRQKIDQRAISDLDSIFRNEASDQLVLNSIERLLFIFPNNHPMRFNLIQMQGDIYYDKDNKALFLNAVQHMKLCTNADSKENAQVIDDYAKMAESIQTLDETLDGYWLSDKAGEEHYRKADYCGGPLLVLNFGKSFSNHPEQTELFSPMSSFLRGNEDKSIRFPDSCLMDPYENSFAIEFLSERVKQGNADVAAGIRDADREFQASLVAKREGLLYESFKTQMQATLVSGVIGIGSRLFNNWLATKVSTSVVTSEQVVLQGIKRKRDEFGVKLSWTSQKLTSGPEDNYLHKDTETLRMWRWNREDNIVFGDRDCNVISPYHAVLTQDMELFHIKKETQFWQPKYAIPLIGGCVGTIGLFAGGLAMVAHFSAKNNNSKSRTLISVFGSLACVTVLAAGLDLSISLPIFKQKKDRARAVGAYNEIQMNKLNKLKNGE